MKKTKFFSKKCICICLFIVIISSLMYCLYNSKKVSIYGYKYSRLVKEGMDRFPKEARNYKLFLGQYDEFGDYLNYGKNKEILFNFENLKFDDEGLPMVKYGEKYYYNPVTLAQYALTTYGEYLQGKNTKENFLKIVDRLISLQDERGAFLYNFEWRYYLNDKDYEPGWVSGMAQGQALSVFTRAYHITGNKKYVECGDKAYKFLNTDINDGGVKTNLGYINEELKNNIIFEEYISSPPSYTLNGFMFAILGIYDWSKLECDVETKGEAGIVFEESIDSLAKILKYYDLGGFSSYDLGHLTRKDRKPHIAPNYHGVHIYLLHALYSVSNVEELNECEQLWSNYVKNIF